MSVPRWLQAKKKNHYVWAQHLLGWSQDNLNVWRTTSRGNISNDSVYGLACEDFFYQANFLSARQAAIVQTAIDAGSGPAKDFHNKLLKDWLRIQSLLAAIEPLSEENQDVGKAKKAMRCNYIEDMHAFHELAVRPVIDALRRSDFSVLQARHNLLPLTMYVGHVITRTKWFRDLGDEALAVALSPEDASDLRNVQWLLSFVMGSNLGQSFYASIESGTQAILQTDEETPFIISDNPAINIHPSAHDGAKLCDIYLPLSPQLALVLCDSGRYMQGPQRVEPREVEELNVLQAQRSHCIFGSDRAAVKRYQRHLGASIRKS